MTYGSEDEGFRGCHLVTWRGGGWGGGGRGDLSSIDDEWTEVVKIYGTLYYMRLTTIGDGHR